MADLANGERLYNTGENLLPVPPVVPGAIGTYKIDQNVFMCQANAHTIGRYFACHGHNNLLLP